MRREYRPLQPIRQPKRSDQEQTFAFRRSRTITGSATDSVRAVSEHRAQLQSPRLHEHSLRHHRRKLASLLVLSVVAAAALWYVVTSFIGNNVAVGTAATQPVGSQLDTARYQTLVKRYLDEHPFERFSFALEATAFERYMVDNAAELSGAALTKDSALGNATVTLKLREPIVAWNIRNQRYFVDATGNAFTTNYFAMPTVVVADKSGVNADVGSIASTKLLRFIGRVMTLVNASGLPPVQSVELPADSTRQVDFRLRDKPYSIKTNQDRDPAGQAADIINAVTYVEEKGISPQYLDVRVSSKAFYRD